MFVDYKSLIFSDLVDKKTVLLSVERPTFLNAINVCNTSKENIRINLQIVRLLVDPKQENYLVKNVLIQPNESHNLMSLGNLEVFLQDGDNILCFSNGYSEQFDCTICYTELKEETCKQQ